MKIECSCGAKYEFEVRPEMREHPVMFVCPACGLDASTFVDSLVRKELRQTGTPAGEPIQALTRGPIVSAREHTAPAERAEPAPRVGLRLHRASGKPELTPVSPVESLPACPKHPGQIASEKCYICSKPICPKCMELFGYVCSPLCKAKAESHGVSIPAYEGQKSRVEARVWRKVVWVSMATGGLLACILALWFWYAWFGCAPRTIFSVRFAEAAYSGQSALAGPARDQIVFLHGGTLARFDLKSGKEMWSRLILERDQIQRAVDAQVKATKALIDKANSEAWEQVPKMPSPEQLAQSMERQAAAALTLHLRGRNIWVAFPEKLVRYRWETGEVTKEVPTQAGLGEPIFRGNDALVINTDQGKPVLTRVDLASGDARQEGLAEADSAVVAETLNKVDSNANATANTKSRQMAGLPTASPGIEAGKPMDPSKVAAQAQRMSLPEKIALPATLAGNINQQRAMNELNDSAHSPSASRSHIEPGPSFSLVPTRDGFLELSVKLLESRMVARSAMKPGSGKSALEGEVTAGKSMEMANDMLNEMQHSNGGDLVEEDHSRYQVTVRRAGISGLWTGEVVGPPKLYPLDTVAVLAADKLIIVLNKQNQKLWQSSLAYNVPADLNALDEESATYGRGPCVERSGSLYVFDEGVLSAFDLATGNARWRFPSVGIAGLFFDDHDMLYVNTTTASHESLKYSRQIDLSRKVVSAILKLDSRNGKTIWSEESSGLVNYVSGRLVLTAASFMPEEQEGPDTGFEKQPWLRIRRINSNNGRQVWEHFQDRAPLDIAFDKNTIRLVFKKEVQVLKFPSF